MTSIWSAFGAGIGPSLGPALHEREADHHGRGLPPHLAHLVNA